jgi:plastocyanin
MIMRNPTLPGGAAAVLFAVASLLGCSHDNDRSSTDASRSSAPSGSGKSTARETTVEIGSNHRFMPAEVTIREGESVVWKNTSDDTHTVTDDPTRVSNREDVSLPPGAKAFHSGDLRPGRTYRQTFAVAGTYRYVCLPHMDRGMKGTVIVRPMEPESH